VVLRDDQIICTILSVSSALMGFEPNYYTYPKTFQVHPRAYCGHFAFRLHFRVRDIDSARGLLFTVEEL
jgi:hypothetical protein